MSSCRVKESVLFATGAILHLASEETAAESRLSSFTTTSTGRLALNCSMSMFIVTSLKCRCSTDAGRLSVTRLSGKHGFNF